MRGDGGIPEQWPGDIEMLTVAAIAVFEEYPDFGLTWPEICRSDLLADFSSPHVGKALLNLKHRGYLESVPVSGTQHAQDALSKGERLHPSVRITRITELGMDVFQQLVAKEFEAAS